MNTYRRATFQVDRLKCKRKVIELILEHKSNKYIEKEILKHNEKCSKSSIARYKNQKFIKGEINTDGSIKVYERQGLLTKIITYPPINTSIPIKTELYAGYVLFDNYNN